MKKHRIFTDILLFLILAGGLFPDHGYCFSFPVKRHDISAGSLDIILPAGTYCLDVPLEDPGKAPDENIYRLTGMVLDQDSLPMYGALVNLRDGTGTVTGADGKFSLSLGRGRYRLNVSYLGYKSRELRINLKDHTDTVIYLNPLDIIIEQVIVDGRKTNHHIAEPIMGSARLSPGSVKNMPALMGEIDLVKAIQLLPGVQPTSEGGSGFSVRGGSNDQNLIVLDDATLFNASHLMGFLSVFNTDAVSDIVFFKGDIPASFGGRLSSLLEVSTREGNNERFSASGGIGLISSRLTLEGPVAGGKSNFMVSGRRTYADLFLALSSDEDLKNSSLYFYDLNAKLSWNIDQKNSLWLNGYYGHDNMSVKHAGMNFGNASGSLRWRHDYNSKLWSDVVLAASRYDYELGTDMGEEISQNWISDIGEFGAKADFTWLPHDSHKVLFGYGLFRNSLSPGDGGGQGEKSVVSRIRIPRQNALIHGLYMSAESRIVPSLTVKYGLRYNLFQNISNGKEIKILTDYNESGTKLYKKGKVYRTIADPEPRVGLVWEPRPDNYVKASWSRTVQYIQIASNSTAGSPLDVWFQSSHNVSPQRCDQFSAGYSRNLMDGVLELSVELYRRDMRNVIDFKDHADLMLNEDLEQELRFGKGYSYGIELLIRKHTGRFKGWLGYTWSHSRRKIDEINGGDWYRSPYDRPHSLSVTGSYEISGRWTCSMNWIYITGSPITYPSSRYKIENNWVPIYVGRNRSRLPDYHRLDLSAGVKLGKKGRRFSSDLVFSVYNAYGRKNPWTVYYLAEENNPDKLYMEQIYLFSVVPSVTWNFRF